MKLMKQYTKNSWEWLMMENVDEEEIFGETLNDILDEDYPRNEDSEDYPRDEDSRPSKFGYTLLCKFLANK